MPLILAIEPDRRQAAQLSAVVRKRVHAELILVDTTERALDAIGNRMPDLVLVPALLSPQDDAALAAALRVIAAAARVQMLTIPVLGTPRPAAPSGGMLSALRRKVRAASEPDGCDPAVFAEQIASYLERADEERSGDAVEMTASADAQPPDEFAWPGAHAPAGRATEVVEAQVNSEWLQPLPAEIAEMAEAVDRGVEAAPDTAFVADEPELVTAAPDEAVATGPDESVSLAVEEAVRNLFADSTLFEPAPEPAAPAAPVEAVTQAFHEPAIAAAPRMAPAPPPMPLPTPKAPATEKDEWIAVEELIASLQLMPLAAIEVTAEDEWIAPVRTEAQRLGGTPAYRVDEAENDVVDSDDVIDLTRTFSDAGSSQPLAAASPATAAAPAAKSEREWVALIESLRHDVERLRVERAEKPGTKAPAAKAARPDPRPDRAAKPAQDEWGFFDPEQCGFAALLAKLDEVTDSDDGRTNH